MKRLTLAVGLLSLAAAAVRSAEAPAIVPAVVEREGVMFDSPVAFDWASRLPLCLRPPALSADAVRRRRLFGQRSEYGTTEVRFALPLPVDLRRRSYLFLDASGVHQVRLTRLTGTARIFWTGDADVVQRVDTFGKIVGAIDVMSGGGFVVSTAQPVMMTAEPSTLSADALLAPNGGSYQGQGSPFRQIVRQYQVRQIAPFDDRWIWVQWRPDTEMVEIGCTIRMSLFHFGPVPSQVASLDAGCDV